MDEFIMFIMKNENGSEKLMRLDLDEHRSPWGTRNRGNYALERLLDITKAGQKSTRIVDVIINVDERRAYARGQYVIDDLLEIAKNEKIFTSEKTRQPEISLFRAFVAFDGVTEGEDHPEEYLCKWVNLFKLLHMGMVNETILNEVHDPEKEDNVN